MNLAEQLAKLQTLREQGALTEQEFTQAKAQLLNSNHSAMSGTGSVNDFFKTSKQTFDRSTAALTKLRRSDHDKYIAGVCAGVATSTDTAAWVWRVVFLALLLVNGLGVLMYAMAWLVIPRLAAPLPLLGNKPDDPNQS